jgi:hypothetical protein
MNHSCLYEGHLVTSMQSALDLLEPPVAAIVYWMDTSRELDVPRKVGFEQFITTPVDEIDMDLLREGAAGMTALQQLVYWLREGMFGARFTDHEIEVMLPESVELEVLSSQALRTAPCGLVKP